ncbi:MAG: ABC transporter permease [Bryobacteraceae bacterium]
MGWVTEIGKRLGSLGRRGAIESRLDEEIGFHVDQQTDKNLRAGMSREEARRRALLKFGGLERTKEATRDEIRPALLEDLLRDLRHGCRVLSRAPGFTAAAVLTLALGIGGTSAIFSVVRAVMLEPLPYQQPDRIVSIWETSRSGDRNVIAPANFVVWRERTRTLEHLGMVGPITVTMIVDGQPSEVAGLTFSSAVFRALGVQPALGRAYTPEEDFRADAAVIVLSHEFWQGRLGGRQDVLHMTVGVNGQRRSVIGVMPPAFTVVGQKADFLIPIGQTIEQLRAAPGRGNSYAIARLGEGVSRERASAEMRSVFAQLEKEDPRRNAGRSVMLLPLQEQMVGDLRPAALALVGAVVLLLLVACVNVANLLLARSAAREREVGIRTAIGATRARLMRQMLSESLLLALACGVAGLGVAALCHRGLLVLVGSRIPIPRLDQVKLDAPVIAFTMLVALATGIVFGLVPAFVTTTHAGDALREGRRHGAGRRLRHTLSTLVVGEVALSLVLLAAAGLLMRSLLKLQSIDPGFRADGVLTARVRVPPTRYDFAKADRFFQQSLSRIAAIPGVQHAAGTQCLPLVGPCIGTGFWRLDRPKPLEGQVPSAQVRPITPSFFRTMSVPQLAGRDFSSSDVADSTPVAIVSEALVREHFAGDEALGRRLRVGIRPANAQEELHATIIGVVRDIKLSSLEGPVGPTIYLPSSQLPARIMTFVVRTGQDPASFGTSITKIVQSLESEVPVEVRTLEDVVGATIARPRALSVLVGVFALVALALAAIGVYGVMAYSVRERTQEIGLRMALGASARSVFRLVLGQALRLALTGIAVGLVAAAVAARMLKRLLYEVAPLDPWTFASTALALLVVAVVASYVPARRSTHMVPIDALRTN